MEPLANWLSAAQRELGLDEVLDVRLLLDLSRQVAHAVERPAAPLTTYLLGVAAGREAPGGRSSAELAEAIERLAGQWVKPAS